MLSKFTWHKYISSFTVEGEQYDQAVSLAEKYCDFRTLVEVCDRTNNQERLTQYMNRFGSEVSHYNQLMHLTSFVFSPMKRRHRGREEGSLPEP